MQTSLIAATTNTAAKKSRIPLHKSQPSVRVGIGGWNYAPWRDNFYPADLKQADELAYASRHVSAIEINSTFYGLQKPAIFARWRDATPDDFMFSLKAPRFATHRRILADSADSIERFIDSGFTELGAKLGPVVWQFAPTKAFERDDFAAFLALLPRTFNDRPLRHVLEVRHPSFLSQEYLALAREYEFPTVFTDSDKYPSFADRTGGFVYARLMRSSARLKAGYTARAFDDWTIRAQDWSNGVEPDDLPYIDNDETPAAATSHSPADVFIFFINGAKERAPAAAQALIHRLHGGDSTAVEL